MPSSDYSLHSALHIHSKEYRAVWNSWGVSVICFTYVQHWTVFELRQLVYFCVFGTAVHVGDYFLVQGFLADGNPCLQARGELALGIW